MTIEQLEAKVKSHFPTPTAEDYSNPGELEMMMRIALMKQGAYLQGWIDSLKDQLNDMSDRVGKCEKYLHI